ncbi:RsmB/NOP family class I SAM-dependent RNA methyltransferase [Candidatus Microgenomates bacterium]|nr:RsmB/NOP family class I SAM-dependent RNA methyltransferase [Candidatus Microgenomates bacterium]
MNKRQAQLPRLLKDRLQEITLDKYNSVLHSFSVRRPTTIRANTLKISGPLLLRDLRDLGVKLDTVNWCKEAFIVRNKSLKDLRLLKYYQEGYLYVQSLSSMIPALVLDPKPGEKILDLCAAPGSKTTQMAAMMENEGEIVANEPNPIRAQKLNANLLKQGVTNTKMVNLYGEDVYKKYSDYFDRVLVDAPCSGEGRIHTYDPETFRGWSLGKIERYVKVQKKLLISAVLAVKKGGIIVYSTCTLEPEENKGVVDEILQKAGGYLVLEEIKIEGKEGEKGKKGILRVWPDKLMEGFFIAKMRKR